MLNAAYLALFDDSTDCICLTDAKTRELLYLNASFLQYLGITDGQAVLGRRYDEVFSQKAALCPLPNPTMLTAGQPYTTQLRDEKTGLLRRLTCLLYEQDGRTLLLTSIKPLSELRFSLHKGYRNLSSYLADYRFSPNLLIDTLSMPGLGFFFFFGDMQHNTYYISDTMRYAFGFPSNIITDFPSVWAGRIAEPLSRAGFLGELNRVISTRQTHFSVRHRVQDATGQPIWVHCNGLLEWNDADPRPLSLVGLVTKQDYDFVVDPVTNLPLTQTAISHLALLRVKSIEADALAFSLNSFFEVNNSIGRAHADRLLHEFIGNLTAELDESAQLFRLDGMCFLCILSKSSSQTAEQAIEIVRTQATAIYRKFGVMIEPPCSVGLLYYPTTDRGPIEFIDDALALISLAKSQPDRPYLLHSAGDVTEQRAKAQMALDLSRDVLGGFQNFRVVLQPIVDAKTGYVVGGETLLRWRHNGEEISPAVFVPMLESNKMIIPAGRWVFEQTVAACAKILQAQRSTQKFYLSFNVSYLQVMDDNFIPFMRDVLERYAVSARHLVMELTEMHCDDVPEKLARFIAACRELGMGVALDDFGSGYSSLSLLLKYPANIVKLDRSLTIEATQSENNVKLIESIVYSCHQFGRGICAEGVENENELSIYQKVGCDFFQGFYFYRPQELDSFFDILQKQG